MKALFQCESCYAIHKQKDVFWNCFDCDKEICKICKAEMIINYPDFSKLIKICVLCQTSRKQAKFKEQLQ